MEIFFFFLAKIINNLYITWQDNLQLVSIKSNLYLKNDSSFINMLREDNYFFRRAKEK